MAGQSESRTVEIIFNGKRATASIGEMKAAVSILGNQLDKLPQGSKEFIEKSKEYKAVRQRLSDVSTSAKGVNKAMTLLNMTAQNFLGIFGGMWVVQKIGQFFGDAGDNSKKFEKSLSTLSSITGAVGEDLEFYRQKAQEMGEATTLSATQVADAFTLIGSKKPELLKNKEALVSVTKETIALAEAAEIDLVPAADAMTAILNQWGEPASEASRVINVLAAGSKEGAGDINYLSDSMRRFGPTAKAMKVGIEQSAAVMELFAEKGLESEKAGTQFRNILVKLASGADETNPQIVGLQKAIENLGKEQLSTAELAKRFGSENLSGAQILSESAERVKFFTAAVTGTNVAYEQQAINVNNLDGDIKALDSAYESLTITTGDELLPVKRNLVQILTQVLLVLKEIPSFIRENKDLFIALGIAILAMNTTTIAATASTIAHLAVEKGRQLALKASAISQHLLNAAMTANPIGLVIKAVALLVAGFVLLYNRSETVRAGIAGIVNVAKEAWEMIKETFGQFTGGFQKLMDGDITGGLIEIGKGMVKASPVGLAVTAGKRLGKAFTDGYKEKLEAEKAMKEEKEAAAVAAEEGNEVILEQEAEHSENLKKEAEERKKLQEEYAKKKLDAERKIQDLRVELIDGDHEREREKTIIKFERDIEDLVAQFEKEREAKIEKGIADREQLAVDETLFLEQKLLLEQNKELALKELADKHQKEREAKDKELRAKALEELDKREEMDLLRLENSFANMVDSEQQYEDAVYELRKKAAEEKIALAKATYGEESMEALKATNALVKLNKEHLDKKLEDEKAFKEAKQALLQEGFNYAKDVLDAGLTLLKEESNGRAAAGRALKAVSKAKVMVDLYQEIAAIWKNSNSNLLNILIPGWGAVQAGIMTIAASARAGAAVKKINMQQFAAGGSTLPLQSIGSFSGGGNIGVPSMGIIGEKGPEWVAPNWMMRNPATANVIGMLEAMRQNRQFASGGMTGDTATGSMGAMGMDTRIWSSIDGKLSMLNENVVMLRQELAAIPDQWKVYNVLTEVESGLKTLQQIRDDADIK